MIVREYGWHAVPDPFNTMKPIIYRAWLGAMSLMLLTTTGRAQTCLGGASFKQRTAQIGTELSRSANSEATTVGVGLGDTHGTFGSIGLGRVHDDDVSDNATVFSGKAGHGFRLWSAPETELCPFVSAVIVNGVNLPTGEAINYRDY